MTARGDAAAVRQGEQWLRLLQPVLTASAGAQGRGCAPAGHRAAKCHRPQLAGEGSAARLPEAQPATEHLWLC